MTRLRRLLMIAAWAAATCGSIALFSPIPAQAQSEQFSSPIPLAKNEQDPAHSFVAKYETISIPLGVPSVTKPLYTVPAGKIFVLQHFSAVASVPSGQVAVLMLEGTSGGAASKMFISLQLQGSFANLDFSAASSAATAYFDPGSTLSLFAFKSAVVGSGSMQLQLYGYLVDR